MKAVLVWTVRGDAGEWEDVGCLWQVELVKLRGDENLEGVGRIENDSRCDLD